MYVPAVFDELEKIAMSLDLISRAKSARTKRMLNVLNTKIDYGRIGAKIPSQLEGSLIKQQKKQMLLDRAEKAARMRQPDMFGKIGRMARGPGTPRDPGLLKNMRTSWSPEKTVAVSDDALRSAAASSYGATNPGPLKKRLLDAA